VGSGLAAFRQALQGSRRITVDTNCCIYFLERKAVGVQEFADYVFELAGDRLASVELPGIARLELMVGPLRSGDAPHMLRVRRLIERIPGVTNVDISEDVLLAAAAIRATTKLKTPDALVAGSALVRQSDVIVGNDKGFAALEAVPRLGIWGAAKVYRMPRYIHMNDYLDDRHA
jgi:predicted nucleic acid-binding protein